MAFDVNRWAPSPSNYITCYIYNLITNDRIEFKTIPSDVSETYSGEWQSTEVMGRSAPYLAFTGNPSRNVDYSVSLHRAILGDEFESTIDKCKRLVYPTYASNSIVVPPYCYVRFGGMITMYAIVESVSVSWNGESGVIAGEGSDPNLAVFSQAEISFSFQELRASGQGLPTALDLRQRVQDF